MRLQLEDGQEVELRFAHGHVPTNVPLAKSLVRGTDCECRSTIGFTEPGFFATTFGRALCNATDQFNRATGRRIALTRAIAHFPRAIRTQIWKAYFAYLRNGQ